MKASDPFLVGEDMDESVRIACRNISCGGFEGASIVIVVFRNIDACGIAVRVEMHLLHPSNMSSGVSGICAIPVCHIAR